MDTYFAQFLPVRNTLYRYVLSYIKSLKNSISRYIINFQVELL